MSHRPSVPVLGAPSPIERLLSPFARFLRTESSGGIILLVATAAALIWANSDWNEWYDRLWHQYISVGFGSAVFRLSLEHFINDGLMVVFFFLVGLEIKREVQVGELASVRQAALPIAAALGGMVVPAGIYAAINARHPGITGWGIPMATDIAFALGVLALMGPRVPLGLKVFLAALAIVDDLGAVLVIALFYTDRVSLLSLGLAAVLLAVLVLANRLGVRHPGIYATVGIALWLAFLQSGVHATVAGVLLAMTIPARTRINTAEFLDRGRHLMDEFDAVGEEGRDMLTNPRQQEVIQQLEDACEQAQAPLQRIEHDLQLWVAFAIIPLFALANAGVGLGGNLAAAFSNPVTLGVLLGLVIGKPLGITLFAWGAVRSGLAALPERVSWRALHGVSWLGGIGFTMSLFIGHLAFGPSVLLDDAKIGILTASLLAGIVGWLLLRGRTLVPEVRNERAELRPSI